MSFSDFHDYAICAFSRTLPGTIHELSNNFTLVGPGTYSIGDIFGQIIRNVLSTLKLLFEACDPESNLIPNSMTSDELCTLHMILVNFFPERSSDVFKGIYKLLETTDSAGMPNGQVFTKLYESLQMLHVISLGETLDIANDFQINLFPPGLYTIDGNPQQDECYTIVIESPKCVINTHLGDFYISRETYETLIKEADEQLSCMGGYPPGEVPEWAKLKYILKHFNWCLP